MTWLSLPELADYLETDLRTVRSQLRDAGYNDDEAQEWLRRFEPELRDTPLGALIGGHTHAVRRVIAGLAF
ncbi:Rv2175c family DNA-binding protein [Actinotignum sp. GS-2025a]|uniref:Rv2175c family DNA-binding protein n=1 Tax=Actinotignum sp. GS-2025a TaxID=3427274 RepID=UPI003F48A3FD